MNLLVHWIVSAGLLVVVAHVVQGFAVTGAVPALIAAAVLGLVNAIVKPIAILLTLPLTVLTLGLFLLVVNGLMLLVTATLVPGFQIQGLLPAVWGALLLTVLNLAIDRVLRS